jgi:chromosome segregation ATPase
VSRSRQERTRSEQDADALYGLPLEDFTKARNELAEVLRAQGDRPAANRVKALPKPTTAAWAVNQVMRTQHKDARELLAAGEHLRKVHADAAVGDASAQELRAAVEAEREVIGRLRQAASGLIDQSGRGLSESMLERVSQTLHALSADDEIRSVADATRLSSERQAAGVGSIDAPPSSSRRRKPAPRAIDPARIQKARERLRRAQQEARDLRSSRTRAAKATADAEQKLVRAREQMRKADAEVANKESEVENLRRKLEELTAQQRHRRRKGTR